MAVPAEARRLIEETNERYREAELYRLSAELLPVRRNWLQAETGPHKAIAVTRRQNVRSWGLRARTDLARLRRAQGKMGEVRQMPAATYGRLMVGLDTPEPQAAKALPAEASQTTPPTPQRETAAERRRQVR